MAANCIGSAWAVKDAASDVVFRFSLDAGRLLDDLADPTVDQAVRQGILDVLDEAAEAGTGVADDITGRIFRSATDDDIQSINDLYDKYSVSPTRNIATTKGTINGQDINLESVSGKIDPVNPSHKGNFTIPDENYYKGSNNRLYDSEQK